MSSEYEMSVVDELELLIQPSINRNEEARRIIEKQTKTNKKTVAHQKAMLLGSDSYSPRCDIAIGPFAFEDGSLNTIYEELLDVPKIRHFLRTLSKRGVFFGHETFLDRESRDQNKNPRCFIAIEIENKTSRKHYMGSVINASIMGKVGILVSHEAPRMHNMIEYFKTMITRGKIPPILRNVIWITKSDFDACLEQLER